MILNKWFLRFITALLLACVLTGSASAGAEMIINGDFSSGSTGWTVNDGADRSTVSTDVSFVNGVAQLKVVMPAGGGYGFAQIYQMADLTYVDTLSVSLKDISGITRYGRATVEITDGFNTLREFDLYSVSPSSYQTYTVDVSDIEQSVYVTITLHVLSTDSDSASYILGIDDVSAISTGTSPTYISSSLSSITATTGSTVTATISVTTGNPDDTTFYVNWGDGLSSSTRTTTGGTITESLTHTYTSPGTYTVTGSAFNTVGSTALVTIGTITVVHLDFSAYPTSGDPPLSVQFSVSAQNIESLLWNFGDGTTSTAENPVHTYAASSTPYTVTLTGYTALGYPVNVTKSDYILASAQRLLFNKTNYEAGETATISWQLRDPDFTNYQYTLQILASDSQGNVAGTSIITPYTVNSASGSYSWDTNGTSGYYTAAIYRSGQASPVVFATTNVYTQATLTVNLATSGVTYTNATTVTLSQNGVIVATQTTSTGQTQFTVNTGAYIVSATTTGYATQTATVNLLESTAITIDFVTGTSDSTFPSGAGSFYQSTFATFRVVDKTYGTELAGATITGYAVEATNPIEWLANIYGLAWGGKIIGSEVKAVTDSEGLASFVMFTNVRYSLTLTHPDLPNPVNRTFALTSLSTEYPWYVDIPHEKDPNAQTSITTTASVNADGLINITYNDASLTTTLVTVNVWQKDDENNYTILMDTTTALGNANTISIQLVDFSGANIQINLLAESSEFGTVERNYYHTFPGPWFDLGLPAGMYIWICLLTAVLLGGISPFVNSYACCFVICFFEWVYWFFGWFFEIGQPTAALLLATATVLSIIYYIASRR